jgi:protocatechuate 3,4-dioxygenase beta subunit
MKILVLLLAVVLIIGIPIFILSPQNTSPPPQNQAKEQAVASQDCGKPLVSLTEGPYYKPGSPERQKIADPETVGTHLILKGYVYDIDCKPIKNVWLDFWQADGKGSYDNDGYNLRGHQYTNEEGFFRIETVVPEEYPGRTPHIHFKVKRSENSPTVTSQLFFPDSAMNSTDAIFDESLVVAFGTDPDGSKYASFNIVLPD